MSSSMRYPATSDPIRVSSTIARLYHLGAAWDMHPGATPEARGREPVPEALGRGDPAPRLPRPDHDLQPAGQQHPLSGDGGTRTRDFLLAKHHRGNSLTCGFSFARGHTQETRDSQGREAIR